MHKIKCLAPFTNMEVTKAGIFPCCPAWPTLGSLGDVRENSLMDIWNGEKFRYLREKMYKNKAEDVCSVKNCPFMISGSMIDMDTLDKDKYLVSDELIEDIKNQRTELSVGPSKITLSDSGACNLQCIMCGSGENYRHEDEEVKRRTMGELKRILPHLRQIRLTGDGDPFFRTDTREFLETFDPVRYPNVQFIILTNGLLLTPKMWGKIRHNNISEIWVSVDAATKETYEKIRIGGKWEKLQDNLRMISEIRREGKVRLFEINMTVMRSNYREIIDFVRLGKKLGCDSIALQRFYGDRPERENIFDPPDRNVLMAIKGMFNDPIFSEVKVWREGLDDVQRYTPSLLDDFNYEKYSFNLKLKKLYDRYIGWRFKQHKI